ncbi:MAG: Na(+)-translocating NADH-quinone reductase subunit A [bacterium]|nr:MAG: Na(+)-translocating NADH-quinone reductase subunit A [bacterium]
MGLTKITKGLNVPITGTPEQVIGEGNIPKKVAILGDDYVGMKPTMEVQEGEKVKTGQLLFTDKKLPKVRYTSPGSGTVIEINRGEKRKFLSVVIELDKDDEITFPSYSEKDMAALGREKVVDQLLESGLWTALRTRPLGKVANPDSSPHSIFITAMNSEPLGPDVSKIIEVNRQNFITGLEILSKLTEGKLFLCKYPDTNIPTADLPQLSVEEFSGPHPSGLAGTHIHFLDPVGRKKIVWYLNAQDVIAVGVLFTTGKLSTERIVALAGPSVKNPRLIRTRLGAALDDVVTGELKEGENRLISGSVLSGHKAAGPVAYLGRFHQQISVIPEGRQRKFFGWLSLGFNLYSVKRILASSLIPGKKYDFTTAQHGGYRSIVPIGSYEKVMPLDILATYLLRAIAVMDVEEAENLGCLELDEEDLALCTFVCPSKIDHGQNLRQTLNLIEKEG